MCIDINCLISQFLGTILGAVIGAGASIYATKVTVKSQFELLDKKDEKEAQATICAIIAELKTIKKVLKFTFNDVLFTTEPSFDYSLPLDTDYCVIFNANVSKIGKIENEELRNCIVELYISIKYFLDCIRSNNELLEEYNKTIWINPIESGIKNIQELINEAQENLNLSKKNNLIPTYNNLMKKFDEFEQITRGAGRDE